jgi:flagellar basal body-associated protein FliL
MDGSIFRGMFEGIITAFVVLIIVSIAGCVGTSYYFYKKGQQHPLANVTMVIETNQVVTTNYIINGKTK